MRRKQKTIRLLVVIVTLVLICLSFFYFFKNSSKNATKEKQRSKQNVPSVVLDKAQTIDIPIYITALGSVTSSESVVVRPQMNGQLLQILFTEGDLVNKGDLLAIMDSKPFEAALKQYEGQFARDTALLKNAELDLERYKKLYPFGSISKQTLDTQQSLVNQYLGNIKSDEGLIENAKINIQYCHIKSPISGKVGLKQVDAGNYVQTSDPNGIVVVNTINPIDVLFSIPEDRIPEVMEKINAKKSLTVEALNREQNKLLTIGKFLSIDNKIDVTTGTIKLKAKFKNDKNILFPNQFVNIKLLVDTIKKAITVPSAAVHYSPKGTYVYLYQVNNKVKVTPVKIGITNENNIVITSGINSDDSVVVEGADKLVDNASVIVADNVN